MTSAIPNISHQLILLLQIVLLQYHKEKESNAALSASLRRADNRNKDLTELYQLEVIKNEELLTRAFSDPKSPSKSPSQFPTKTTSQSLQLVEKEHNSNQIPNHFGGLYLYLYLHLCFSFVIEIISCHRCVTFSFPHHNLRAFV